VKSIFDRSFHYTPSAQMDIKKTFARIREQRLQTGSSRTGVQAAAETGTKVVSIQRSGIDRLIEGVAQSQ